MSGSSAFSLSQVLIQGDVFQAGLLGDLHDIITNMLVWLENIEGGLLYRILLTFFVIGVSILLGRTAGKALEGYARSSARRQGLDEWQTRTLVSRTRPFYLMLRLSVWLIVVLVILILWGLQNAFVSLLTAAGFAGIVIGMAASNTLSNLIAGFIIFSNNPFNIGDWVLIEGEEGVVIDVQAGATVIQTWDGEKVTFPNRVVEGSKVKNFSHQRSLRRRFAIGIDYATDIRRAREILLEILQSHPDILKEPSPQVIGQGFGDSSINLECRYWVAPLRAQIMLIQTWLMQEVQRRFAREGIVIPFPQRTIVHRYTDGNPPPGDTVSTLAYDPETDTQPFPAPPLRPPQDLSSTHARQQQHPSTWWSQMRKFWPHTKAADDETRHDPKHVLSNAEDANIEGSQKGDKRSNRPAETEEVHYPSNTESAFGGHSGEKKDKGD